MTWGEFKAVLASQGVRDDEELAYIDWRRQDAPTVNRLWACGTMVEGKYDKAGPGEPANQSER